MLLSLVSYAASSMLVSPGWLQSQLAASTDLCILDVTQQLSQVDNTVSADSGAFAAAHIPGARFVDVGERLSRQGQRTAKGALLHNMLPSAEQFASELESLGVGDSSHVVLYSSTKVMWATRVWWMLRSFGFRGTVSVLDGGLKAWTAAGGEVHRPGSSDPVEATTSSPPQRESSGRLSVRPVRVGAFVGKARVLEAITDPAISLLDSLKPGSYSGDETHIRPTRCHIRVESTLCR